MAPSSFPLHRSLYLAAILAASALPSGAQIGVANSDFLRSTTSAASYTKPFDAGATADKLIVSAAYEGGPANSALTITYHGVALTKVPGTSGNRNEGIWYLDNPHTAGAADIVISGGGTNFGSMGMGIVSIAGSADGYALGVHEGSAGVTLNVPVADSFVFANCAANDGAIPTPVSPLTQLYKGALNSSEGAAAYANGVASGSQSFSFSGTLNSPETSAAVFVPASAAPVIVGTSPADDAVNVLPDVNLTVTFSEPVVAGTGAIVLKNADDDSTVESFDVATSPRLTLSGYQITIDPTNALDPAGGYYVLMDAGVVVDISGGDAFAGIADPTVWNFAGDVPPSLVALSPADDEIHVLVGANLVATFDEAVMAGAGTITLRKSSDNSTVESFDVATSPRISISGAELTIDPTADLDDGVGYHVLIDPTAIEDSAGNPFAGIADPATWNFTTRPGLDTVEGRMVSMLQENIDSPWPGISDPNNSAGVFSYVLACLYLNQNVSQANQLIVDYYTNNPIPANTSTSYAGYFWQHIMWRAYHDPIAGSRLTTQARDLIETNMRNWLLQRSTLTEAQQNVWKIHDSENHDAMQKGSHLMCLIALKNSPSYGPDTVLGDGATVAEHLNAWTGFYLSYFRSRAMEGINVEIACQQYAKYTVGAYYNIMDFSDSPELRALAKKFIDLYWADTVSDWVSSGVRGGGQTRCYREGSYLKTGTSYAFYSTLWGYGWHGGSSTARTYLLIPAISPYRVPDILTAIATDPNRPNFLYSSRRFGRGGGWDGNKDYTVVFDNGDSNLRRDTWVTPDYSMGTLTVDMNKDYIALIDQNRVMGIMFSSGVNDRIMVFGQGGSDPTKSFADTTGVTREDCMIVQRDKNAYQTGTATQIFVAQNAWNNRVETGDWFFTQLGNAYCALRPAGGGYTSTSTGSGYYLTLGDMWAPVIIQTGQAGNYASFTDFQNSVIANSLTYVSGTMNYTSEAGDTFTFYANSKTTPKVNGTTVNLNPAKTYDSPYLSMVHGEEAATVSYSGYDDLVLDFGGPPTLLATDPADDATGVAAAADLVASFSEPVAAGSGFIELRRSSDDGVVETFDVATSPRISFDGTDLTIDPTNDLVGGVGYYVLIESTAVEDVGGTSFAGISDNTAWNFTTDGASPAVDSLSPPDDSIGVSADANLTVTFNEPVLAGTGFVTLKRTSDDSTVETFDVSGSPRLTFGGSTLMIDPSADLDLDASYHVTIDATAIVDLSSNAFAGLAGNAAWNFTTSDGTASPIVAVNHGKIGGSAPGATVTQSIAVGATADMLIVMTASELGGLTGDPMTVSYGGVPMNLAVGNLTNSAIWYLDLSTPGISGTNVVVDMSGYGTRNGFAAGWVSIDGNLSADQSIVVHNTGTSDAQSNTVDLSTTAETFNAVNFNGNNKNGSVTVNSPNPTVIYTDNDIGSARSAAAYDEQVAAGLSTYQWTLDSHVPPNADYRRIDAAAFVVVTDGGNDFSDWIAGYPGVGAETGLDDDPDGDGSDNGVENYFGTDPGNFSQGLIAGSVDTGAKTFTFTHPLNDTPASDLTATYRWSTDLTDFHDDGSPNGAGTTTVIFSDPVADGEVFRVTATISGSVIPDRLFVDVKVTQN